MKYTEMDFRPAILFDGVNYLSISNLKIPTGEILPVIILKGVANATFDQSKILRKNKAVLKEK